MFASIPYGNLLLIHLKHYGINKKVWYKNNIRFCAVFFFVEIKYVYLFPSKFFYILEKRKDNDLAYHSKCRLGKSYTIGFRY